MKKITIYLNEQIDGNLFNVCGRRRHRYYQLIKFSFVNKI